MDPNLDRNLVIVEMVKTISQKLKKIESNLATSDLQVLLMVNDELDDVLLNWSSEMTSALSFKNPVSDEDDEDVDEW